MLLKTASIARSFRVIIEFNMSTTLNSVATIPRKDQCLIAFSVNFTFVSQHLIYSVWNFWWLCSKSRIYSFNLYSSLFQWNHFATANLTCRQNSEHTKVVRSKILYIPRIINWSPDASSENISVHFFRYRAKTSISLFNAFLFHFFSSYDVQKFWFVFQDGKHAHGVRAIEIENSLKNMARIESSKFQNLRKKKNHLNSQKDSCLDWLYWVKYESLNLIVYSSVFYFVVCWHHFDLDSFYELFHF